MIEAIDPLTAPYQVLREVYELRRTVSAELSPETPFDAAEDVISLMRHPPGNTRVLYWVAGSPVHGYAELQLTPGNPTGFVRVVVAEGHRRHGLGRALLDALRGPARRARCDLLTASTGDAGGEAFVAAVGADPGQLYLRAVLRLPVHADAVPPPGYRLRSWTGAAPAELLDSYAWARNAIRDAPLDTGVTLDGWTPAVVRAEERSTVARGRQLRITVALDHTGAVIGFTEVRVSPEPGALASTEDTAVMPAHRRRGVATALKAESLRLLAVDRPDVRLVTTTNSARNEAMLAVNRKLGFELTGRVRGATLRLR